MDRLPSPLVAAVWALLVGLGLPRWLGAQQRSPRSITLTVDGAAVVGLDTQRLQEDLARELSWEVATGTNPRGDALEIRISPDRGAVGTWRATDGTTRVRVVALPVDGDEAARVLLLVGANLVRDQLADLEPLGPGAGAPVARVALPSSRGDAP